MAMTFEDIIAEMLGGASLGFGDEAKGVMEGITSKMKAVNKAGDTQGVMATPATTPTKLPQPINVMRGEDTFDYDFEVDGNTESNTFTGDAFPSPEAIQRMRDMQGITANGQPVTNLGMADPVLMPGRTPTIPEGVATGMHRMPDGTMMSDSDMNYAGTGQPNMDAPVVDPNRFNEQFAALGNQEKSRVEEIMANMTEQQKIDFAAGLTGMPLSSFAVQNENYGSY
jgi:hypothetical protein